MCFKHYFCHIWLHSFYFLPYQILCLLRVGFILHLSWYIFFCLETLAQNPLDKPKSQLLLTMISLFFLILFLESINNKLWFLNYCSELNKTMSWLQLSEKKIHFTLLQQLKPIRLIKENLSTNISPFYFFFFPPSEILLIASVLLQWGNEITSGPHYGQSFLPWQEGNSVSPLSQCPIGLWIFRSIPV